MSDSSRQDRLGFRPHVGVAGGVVVLIVAVGFGVVKGVGVMAGLAGFGAMCGGPGLLC